MIHGGIPDFCDYKGVSIFDTLTQKCKKAEKVSSITFYGGTNQTARTGHDSFVALVSSETIEYMLVEYKRGADAIQVLGRVDIPRKDDDSPRGDNTPLN